MKALFTIVDYTKTKKLEDILRDSSLHYRLVMNGYGTADSSFSDMLGLGENKKSVGIALGTEDSIKLAYRRLEKYLELTRSNAGIAFTVAVSGMSGAIRKLYTEEEAAMQPKIMEQSKEQSPEHSPETNPYSLVFAIVNRGAFEDVKKAAKQAGVRGGTLIRGLGLGGEEAAKFLGINLQPEKDIVVIVVDKADAKPLMQAIVEHAGMTKTARGVCFSLPVESALGLATKMEDEV